MRKADVLPLLAIKLPQQVLFHIGNILLRQSCILCCHLKKQLEKELLKGTWKGTLRKGALKGTWKGTLKGTLRKGTLKGT